MLIFIIVVMAYIIISIEQYIKYHKNKQTKTAVYRTMCYFCMPLIISNHKNSRPLKLYSLQQRHIVSLSVTVLRVYVDHA